MTLSLYETCEIFIGGNHAPTPAELFEQMSLWCKTHDVRHDTYGQGQLIDSFENKIATLLGFEAALFSITGTMAQATLLQLACQPQPQPLVAMHKTCHIYLRENQGYQLQKRFCVLPVGQPYQPWTVDDLKCRLDPIGAVVYELPMREIAGQLPSWQQLEDIKNYCQQQQIHLHLDGARLWECQAYYQHSYQDIVRGFQSAYVSLYKGIGGLSGAMIAGSQTLINRVRLWNKRQGGNVYHPTPSIVSAAMQFDQRLAMMPALFERTRHIYQMLQEYPQLIANPAQPQTNMLHLYLPVDLPGALALRDHLAREHKIWLGSPAPSALPRQSYVEWYVGDNAYSMSDAQLRQVLDLLVEHCRDTSLQG